MITVAVVILLALAMLLGDWFAGVYDGLMREDRYLTRWEREEGE